MSTLLVYKTKRVTLACRENVLASVFSLYHLYTANIYVVPWVLPSTFARHQVKTALLTLVSSAAQHRRTETLDFEHGFTCMMIIRKRENEVPPTTQSDRGIRKLTGKT